MKRSGAHARHIGPALILLIPLLAGSIGPVPPLGDPLEDLQWGLAAANVTAAWDITPGDSGIVVAVVDSGVDLAHLDLLANLWDGNLMHGASLARPVGTYAVLPVGANTTTMDETGHGTLVAGVLGAVAGNGLGVRGVARVSVMVVKVQGLGAPGHVEALADGIRWAADNGADVISVSISAADHPALRAAVRDAWCRGAVIVASAGNEGAPVPRYPAGYPEVVAVGAVDRDLTVWAQSNRGVDLYAPGVDVLTTRLGNLYAEGTGTSLAAPFVSGTAALALSANPGLTNVDVSGALAATAKPLPGADAPLLDAGGAVALAAATVPGAGPAC